MKRLLIALLAVTATLCMVSVSAAFYMHFEEGLGNDLGNIVGIPGVTFVTSGGLPWIYSDVTTGNYNAYSVNTGQSWGTGEYNMYDKVCAWLGVLGAWGQIDFDDQNGTWFQTGVSSATDFWLEAYDASDNMIDVATTGACTQWEGYTDMAWLRVDAPGGTNISYVKLSDSGNFWEVDNMSGDMEGGHRCIPEPSTLLLLGSGLLGLAGYSRARYGRKK